MQRKNEQLMEILLKARGIVSSTLIEFLMKAKERGVENTLKGF
jgi:hypothetical protein